MTTRRIDRQRPTKRPHVRGVRHPDPAPVVVDELVDEPVDEPKPAPKRKKS